MIENCSLVAQIVLGPSKIVYRKSLAIITGRGCVLCGGLVVCIFHDFYKQQFLEGPTRFDTIG